MQKTAIFSFLLLLSKTSFVITFFLANGKMFRNFGNVRIFWGHKKLEDWSKFFLPSNNIWTLLHCEYDWIKIPWPRTQLSKRGHVGQISLLRQFLYFGDLAVKMSYKSNFFILFTRYLFFVKFDLISVSCLFR